MDTEPRDRPLWAALEISPDAVAIARLDEGEFFLESSNLAGTQWYADGERGLREDLHGAAAGALTYGARGRHRIERPGAGGPAVLEVAVTRAAADRVLLIGRDVTETLAEQALLSAAYEQTAQVRAVLQTALDATALAFAVYDVTRDEHLAVTGLPLVLINPAGAAQLEVADPGDLTGGDLRDLFPDAVESGMWQAVLDTLDAHVTTTFRYHETDARGVWRASWDHTMAPVGDDRVVVTWREVTADESRQRELSRAHAEAHHASRHDALTGLPNRLQLQETLRAAAQAPDRDESVALVYVDLDGFKQVNDTLGHASGDLLLQAVAQRLARVVRADDLAVRLGGDEFVLLLRRLPKDWDATGFVTRCHTAVEQPVVLPAAEIVPRASFGLAMATLEDTDLDALLEQADRQMYSNKQAQKQG
ncbi:diguanylate cyclase domain-containing protein [Spongisporangium articulatum]|uniref:Diguanylate cyclase domain-containing protein n=1 Tax=Spongisporangium articulatum TaxID=3362603 RepID=A0ABW8AS23_9ACTN